MINYLLPFLKNVQAGPKTTGLGAALIALGAYLLITSEGDILMQVADSGVVGIGIICFFLKDWQKGKAAAAKEKADE
tara:strand:+ start:217 stop:447 length:231 start_codon:yes stop_codon:yes gene_type:complete